MFRKKRQKYKKVGNHATIFQNCSTFAGKGSFYMRDVEVHSCPELMGLIQEVGFLPLLDSGIAGYSATWCIRMVAGTGRCGSGRDRLCRRATVSMASSLLARRASSAVNGGRTCATGVGVSSLNLRRARLKRRS